MNIGEQIVADYLTHNEHCEFVQQNLQTTESQGEIDVVGINIKDGCVYFCEVAIHVQGLQYVKDKRPNNKNKIIDKFKRIKEYADNHYKDYNHRYMFWSPIVNIPKKAESWNPTKEFEEIKSTLKDDINIDLEVFINNKFYQAIQKLKQASTQSKEMKSPVMRLFQIEAFLDAHIKKIKD